MVTGARCRVAMALMEVGRIFNGEEMEISAREQ